VKRSDKPTWISFVAISPSLTIWTQSAICIIM
jgi:hypothetical protein